MKYLLQFNCTAVKNNCFITPFKADVYFMLIKIKNIREIRWWETSL